MASQKVIVFGPTGQVGSSAALTAHKHGANVVLAMRDPDKTIPALDDEVNKGSQFQRVKADLTKPDTVRNAIKETGAKRAFIYAAHGSSDHMRGTIEALKEANVEFVVFLSSFTIQGDLSATPSKDIIPYLHAQVELNLETVFGRNAFIALRAGCFASNWFRYKSGLNSGTIRLSELDAEEDLIVPGDIGKVSGTILAKGPQDEERKIYVYGPRLISQAETVKILAKTIGKDVKVEKCSEQELYQIMVEEQHIPAPMATFMTDRLSKSKNGHPYGYPLTNEQLLNVEKYSGEKPTTFEEWAEKNKQNFLD